MSRSISSRAITARVHVLRPGRLLVTIDRTNTALAAPAAAGGRRFAGHRRRARPRRP